MTLIIAHTDGWMVADRRTVFDGGLIGPYLVSQIKRAPGILAACAGNGVLSDLLEETLEERRSGHQDALRAVAKMFRGRSEKDGHALALTPLGIAEITSSGGVVRLNAAYWAIGSGFPFAMGYLEGIAQGDSRLVTPEKAMHAINLAARYTNDVGDGYQTEYL